MISAQILVVDLGSQYTLVIARTLRELMVRSAILPPKKVADWLKANKSRGIIFSGGGHSVYQEGAPEVPEEALNAGVPILGICYGMQWLAQRFGGKVVPHREKKEYGRVEVVFDTTDRLFSGMLQKSIVWASHGDSVGKPPKRFKAIAYTDKGKTLAGMANAARKIWSVQFHPEVVQTKDGKKILDNFLYGICGCRKDWRPQDVIAEIRNEVAEAVGNRKAVIGFSGGVDSSTLAAILSPVLGEKFLGVCIDTGALRKNELQEVRLNAAFACVNLKVVKAARRFQEAMGNATHSEFKRKRFKMAYVAELQKAAIDFGGKSVVLVQGTLATDTIESGSAGKAQLIKSHHNVGLKMRIGQLHPFRNLFKHEVRELAGQLGLPSCITERQPFPGPGLFIRVIGMPPRSDKLAIVRWADAEVTRILKDHKLYRRISQLVVGLECLRTVGIKGDERAYGFSVVVRPVRSTDFMTATGYRIPARVKDEIESCITKHPQVVRVRYDENNKPPATIELE